jgi:hypothetical protein
MSAFNDHEAAIAATNRKLSEMWRLILDMPGANEALLDLHQETEMALREERAVSRRLANERCSRVAEQAYSNKRSIEFDEGRTLV